MVRKEALVEKYLGLPTEVGYATSGVFEYLRAQVRGTIDGWCVREASYAGCEVPSAVPTKETNSFYNIEYRIKKYCFLTHDFYNIIHTKSKLNAAPKTDRSIVTTIFTAHMCSVDNTQ